MGPSTYRYDPAYTTEFLNACLSLPGCQVNVLDWHEITGSIPGITTDLLDARKQFLGNPRYARFHLTRMMITPACGGIEQFAPGDVVGTIAALQAGGASAGARSCNATFVAGANPCTDSTLNGILTPASLQPTSVWWAYKLYADGLAMSAEQAERPVASSGRRGGRPAAAVARECACPRRAASGHRCRHVADWGKPYRPWRRTKLAAVSTLTRRRPSVSFSY